MDTMPLPAASSSAPTAQQSGPSSATPMEVGAVTHKTPKPAALPSAGKWTAAQRAEYFKDKTCMACGQKGHSANYAACPQHPRHQEWKKAKSSRVHAADTAQQSVTSPAQPATQPATAGPSTSYAQAAAAGLTEDWKTELLLETANKLEQLSKE